MGPDPAWAIAHAPLSEPASLTAGTLPAASLPLLRNVGQVGATYLVAEGPDGQYLIDQHAAHERVLFEKLLQQQGAGGAGSQVLLEPVTVELAAAEAGLLRGQLEVLRRLGFDAEEFGVNAFRVRAVPPLLAALPPAQALRAVIEDFEEDEAPLADVVEARVAARVSLDVYVSLHRSEGFGLTMAEAMAIGNPVVASAYSGNVDFMTMSDTCLVRTPVITTDRDHGPYPAGTHWGDPDVAQAAEYLVALMNAETRSRIGSAVSRAIRERLNPLEVARRVAGFIGGPET